MERSAKRRFALLTLSVIIAVAYALSALKHHRVWGAVLLVGVWIGVFWWVRAGKTLNAAAVALNYFAYNFIGIHRTLRVSPAMAAAGTDRLWDVNDLVALGDPMNSGGRKERRNGQRQ